MMHPKRVSQAGKPANKGDKRDDASKLITFQGKVSHLN